MPERPIPLSMAALHTQLFVNSFNEGIELRGKVIEMGLHIGAMLEIKQRTQGAVVLMRGNTRYAIDSGLAHRILVTTKA